MDNIFVYQPLPYGEATSTIWMWTCTAISSAGPTSRVNEKVMVTRVDQQLRVTYHMIKSHDLRKVAVPSTTKLGRYMMSYLAMMMAISSICLVIENTPESLGKRTQLWEYLRHGGLRAVPQDEVCRAVSAFTAFPGYQGRRLSVGLYRLARKTL